MKQPVMEMYCWTPGEVKSESEEVRVPWKFAGWRLSKTGPKVVYILKVDGQDLLHFHIETEALVTTPRSTLRGYEVK